MQWAVCALMMCLLVLPASGRAVEIGLLPALGGVAAQDRFGEVALSLRAPQAGRVRVDLPADGVNSRVDIDLPADELVTVRIPYPVPASGEVAWSVEGATGEGRTGRTRVFSDVARHPVVVDLTGRAEAADARRVPATALPETVQGYDAILTLIAAQADLRLLNAAQMQALSSYLLQCGHLIVPDAVPGVLDRLTAAAGCGGRNISSRAGGAPVTELPSTEALLRLSDCTDCHGQRRWLMSLAVGFAAVLLAGSAFAGGLGGAAAGAGFALIVIIGPGNRDPFVEWLQWSNGVSGGGLDTHRSLLVVNGRGKGRFTLPLPEDAVPQLPLPHGARLEYRANAAGTGTAALSLPTRWFQRQSLAFVSGAAGRTETTPQPPPRAARQLVSRLSKATGRPLHLTVASTPLSTPFDGVHRLFHVAPAPGGGQ